MIAPGWGAFVAEIQTAIIVVTDLVGSTALRSEVGEEAAEELRRRHDAMLTDAVKAHDGVVIKGLGDGILARFSGASNAVASACAMQQGIDGRFDIRVGISAGDVNLEDGDCFGTAVIEASRLCDRATGGQILVADIARLLARGRGGHVFEPIGDLELKGLVEPVSTSQVVWDESRYNRVRFPESLRPDGMPFTGRRQVLADLVVAWTSVAGEQQQRTVLVSGEAGIGKSRVASEIALHARDTGGTVLSGRCSTHVTLQHQAFTTALTPLVADLPHTVIEAHVERCGGVLAEIVPMIASRLSGLEAMTGTEGGAGVDAYDAAVDLIRRSGEVAPMLLVLEDLHDADRGTAELCSYLARTDDLGPVLIVGTYRHTEVVRDEPFGRTLADLRRSDHVDRIRLAGLGPGECDELLAAVMAGDHNRHVAGDLHHSTGGNPHLIAEALSRLTDSGTTFGHQRSTRAVLAAVAAVSFAAAIALMVTVVATDWGGSALRWVWVVGAVLLFVGTGSWALAQASSTVTVGSLGLGVRTPSGLRVVRVRWDEIDSIRWRPSRKWVGGPGGFYIETRDGRRLTNSLVDHPTVELARELHDACRRHDINDVSLRARWRQVG
jgi:class 3 adenylate cyclase